MRINGMVALVLALLTALVLTVWYQLGTIFLKHF